MLVFFNACILKYTHNGLLQVCIFDLQMQNGLNAEKDLQRRYTSSKVFFFHGNATSEENVKGMVITKNAVSEAKVKGILLPWKRHVRRERKRYGNNKERRVRREGKRYGNCNELGVIWSISHKILSIITRSCIIM